MATNVLIDGASRNLGKSLVGVFLSRPNTNVIAAVRDPKRASWLDELPTADESKLIMLKLDSRTHIDHRAVVQRIELQFKINRIDIVITNPGVANDSSSVHDVWASVLQEHMFTGAFGPLWLFQEVFPLFSCSEKPIFVGIGSSLATIADMEKKEPHQYAAYGPAKTIVHWFIRKAHFENERFICFAVDPG